MASDPLIPQWEMCKTCGGDHWTRDHPGDFKTCDNIACGRQVRVGTLFCCTPCSLASDGKYEIDTHSEGCEYRDRQRRTAW